MKLKQIPQDFIVNEIYDLKSFETKDEERKLPYFYFKLTKTNYNQLRALEIIAKSFNTSKKLVHFAGTKDKVGVTSQLISIYGVNEDTFKSNLEYLNKNEDLHLEFVGKFKGRLNLGDNLGNHFKIIARDLNDDDIKIAEQNLASLDTSGVLNFFDEQRFGYANNSHIVGKYILLNEVEKAVYEILTSLPKIQNDKLDVFVAFVKEHWNEIKEQNIDIINQTIELAPRFLRGEVLMLEHLKKHKNDFPGAFRRIHKKLRNLYVNAYQSYIFNECIKVLHKKNKLTKELELPLVSFDVEFENKEIETICLDLMHKDEINLANFKLPSMPELKILSVKRICLIFPKNIKISEVCDDNLNEDKKKCLIEFDLEAGSYATNVVKGLFYLD